MIQMVILNTVYRVEDPGEAPGQLCRDAMNEDCTGPRL